MQQLKQLTAADIKRLASIFFLGVCSGYPWVLFSSAMSVWLVDVGESRTNIGLFGLTSVCFTINFLWAPLLDRFQVRSLKSKGQRTSWVLLMLAVIACACFGLSFFQPDESLYIIALFCLVIAFASATQDVAIDAYRVDVLDEDTIPYGAAMATSGWLTGFNLFGSIPLLLKGETLLSWPEIYQIMAMITALLFIAVWCLIQEPYIDRKSAYKHDSAQSWSKGVWQTFVLPFADLVRRYGIKTIFGFIVFLLTFKLGEAFLGRMSVTFYVQVGYSKTDIAYYSKFITWIVSIIFSILGAIVNVKLGIFRGLFIGGIAMALTNLMFAWIAKVGPDTDLFLSAVLLDGFTSAFASVVVVSFIMSITNKTFSASQFALLASIANFGRTLMASSSGAVVDYLDGNWALFFMLTTVMVLPSLLILWCIRKRII